MPNPKHLVNQMRLELKMKERVLKVIEQHDKGLITDFEMWQEIAEITAWALNDIENNR
jgi:hypothetical protein